MRGSRESITSDGKGQTPSLKHQENTSLRSLLGSVESSEKVPRAPPNSGTEINALRPSLIQDLIVIEDKFRKSRTDSKGSKIISQVQSKGTLGSNKDKVNNSETEILKKTSLEGSKHTMKSDKGRNWNLSAVSSSKMKKDTSMISIGSALDSANENLPNVKHDLKYTKLFLQKQGIHNMSIWSHLTDVLNKIIAEQPENVIDYFEEYSRRVKEERLLVTDTLRDIYEPPPYSKSATDLLGLVKAYGIKELVEEELPAAPAGGGEGEEEESEPTLAPAPKLDLEEKAFYFRQAGVAIPDVQLFMLNIAIKKLSKEKSLVNPRFWGKIFGIKQDYFVLESELTEEEYERRAEREATEEASEAERLAAEKEESEKEARDAETESQKFKAEEIDEKGDADTKEEVEETGPLVDKKHYEEIFGEDIFGFSESRDKVTRKSFSMFRGVSFDLGEGGEEEEEEDPLLPPLPPPKKLLTYKIPPLLEPVVKEVIVVPSEKIGEGLNRKVYFVANSPELDWTELPKVTPQQINVARQIKVYFTGDLDAKIVTHPEFPGTEKHYLRAQITRISAGTLVSPKGYYRLGEGGGDDEEEEEEVAEEGEEGEGKAPKNTISENPKFMGVSVKELLDPGLGSWVHHSPHVLRQGRAVWWSSKQPASGEDEEEEEKEEEEEEEEEGEGKGGEEEKEVGAPMLNPLSEDNLLEGSPAWRLSRARSYNNELTVAVIRSTRWPGHTAFAKARLFENIYCGWGHKHLPLGFSPAMLPHPEYEYELGPEIMEIQDPTVEVEQAWRQAHRLKPPPPPEAEETEGEEGEEEDDEEEEDED